MVALGKESYFSVIADMFLSVPESFWEELIENSQQIRNK